MSSITALSVLAFASAVLAVPYVGHHHGHGHQHLHLSGSAAPFPYPTGNGTLSANGTGIASSSSELPTSVGSSSADSPKTVTGYETHFATVYSTIHLAFPSVSAASGPAASGSDEACASDVTVTTTEKVYVTVTGGNAVPSSSEASAIESSATPASSSSSAYPAPAYASSSEAAPISTSNSAAYSVPTSSASSSSEAAPSSIPSSSIVVPKYTSAASSSAAPVASTYAAAGKEASASATASAAPSYSSTASSSSGKRGLGYTDESLLTCFDGSSEISWAYNWASSSEGLSGFTYIPCLWGNGTDKTDSWNSDAKSAISSGSTHLFSFNEPDLSSQANLSPAEAASAYKQWMNPFAGQAKLCAPAVTNGADGMGLDWLDSFMTACDDGCHIDCFNIHWYDSASNVDYFKNHTEQAITIANGKPLYISEFGASGSDDEINTFLETVMPWMDSNDNIAGYAYYYASDGLLVTGTEPSTYGKTYMSYTS